MPRLLLAAMAALLGLAAPASAQDSFSSDNVTYIKNVKEVGDGVGAAIAGNRLFVTSTTHITIFDISDGADPRRIGSVTADVEFENEEVPTNGRILGISGQIGCKDPTQSNVTNPDAPYSTTETTGCLSLYDVSGDSPRFIRSVAGAGSHTSACVLDCSYFYADGGAVTDARDPENARVVANWLDALPDETLTAGCHHVREVSPGIILGSCQPIILLSVRPEDGGSPERPVLLASGSNDDGRFIHSSRWPGQARDRWMLAGGETNASGTCDDTVAAFMTWDASRVINPLGGWNAGTAFALTDEVRPQNGNYSDGWSPVNGLGCSVHWFQEHPSFRNGGLVALAEYENGTRFLQIGADGKITEQGYFLPVGGSTSAPHWHPDGRHAYLIDYTRGMDVVRWDGDLYVPNQAPPAGARPGTGGGPQPLAFSLRARRSTKARFLRSGLRARGGCSRPCSVRVLLQKGRRTIARASLDADGGFAVRLKADRREQRRLRRERRLRLRLVARAFSRDGASARVSRRLTLR